MKQKTLDKRELIEEIKKKRELRGLPNFLILEQIEKYLSLNHINKNFFSLAESKPIIKIIRAKLRKLSGQFEKETGKRAQFLEEENEEALLKTHSSTYERMPFYNEVSKMIYDLKPKTILDLGCGLNPIALAKKGIYYYAFDIREDELKIIKEYFKKKGILGETRIYDLRKKTASLPHVDVCLILKVLDILDSRKQVAENLIDSLKCKYLIVSFPTAKLSGKKMTRPTRTWFETILSRHFLQFEKIIHSGEIFYLIHYP